jgi:hypothetical protein
MSRCDPPRRRKVVGIVYENMHDPEAIGPLDPELISSRPR